MESDAEIVARSRSTDRGAFEELVHRHGQAVHGFLARRGGRQVADELLTEVWLRAFRGRHSYDPRWSDARPWLYGIARNTLRGHRPPRLLPLEGPHGPPVDPWSAVDDRLDAVSQHRVLKEALALLSEDDREVLLLVAWEHLSPAEVATALGIPQGTARSRLHRARTILRRQLADPSGDPSGDPSSCGQGGSNR